MAFVFTAALDVSVIGEMILQRVSYFCQNNVKRKFSNQSTLDGGNEDSGFVSVILKISRFYCVKLILQIMTMINAKEKTEVVLFLEQ